MSNLFPTNIKEYEYDDLRKAATSPGATQDDINALGVWFDLYGNEFWNGEYYDAGGGVRVFPIYQEIGEDDYDVIGYKIK